MIQIKNSKNYLSQHLLQSTMKENVYVPLFGFKFANNIHLLLKSLYFQGRLRLISFYFMAVFLVSKEATVR